MEQQSKLDTANARLAQLRQQYHTANTNGRKVLKNEILKLEAEVVELNANVKQLDKAIRNAEIKSKIK